MDARKLLARKQPGSAMERVLELPAGVWPFDDVAAAIELRRMASDLKSAAFRDEVHLGGRKGRMSTRAWRRLHGVGRS